MTEAYERKVNYYETDKMGIVHHANYIKYFEEARVYFMDKAGLSYRSFEEKGIIMPVLSVEAAYKTSARFDDCLEIRAWLTKVTVAKAFFAYEITIKETGQTVCTGSSAHGFLTAEFKPLNMKRVFPEIFKSLCAAVDDSL